MEKKIAYVDTREQKSPRTLDKFFELKQVTLPAGDFLYKKYLIEFKVGSDIKGINGYKHLKNQLSNMAKIKVEKNPELKLHFCYCDTPDHIMDFAEWKRVSRFCIEEGIYPHHDFSLIALAVTVKDICNNEYKHKLPNPYTYKHLGVLGNMVCTYKGFSAVKAAELEKICESPGQFALDPKYYLDQVFGFKKDGSSKKYTFDFLKDWNKGVKQIDNSTPEND